MFFKKQKRINELEAEVSKLKDSLECAYSDSRFRNSMSTKAIADILNLLSIRGIASDMDCFNMIIPYNTKTVRSVSAFKEEEERYIINIPNIRLNVSKEMYDKYMKSKAKEE